MSQQVKRRPERIQVVCDKALYTLMDLRKVAREGMIKSEANAEPKAFNRSASRWATWCIDRIGKLPEGGGADTVEEAKTLLTRIAREGEEYLEVENLHDVIARFCEFVRTS
ncbi:MAG: hypothetical protein HY873_09005 [Chloroflexi bacterium]|nr:hypothetical protein [Chloroflexota bacterium]